MEESIHVANPQKKGINVLLSLFRWFYTLKAKSTRILTLGVMLLIQWEWLSCETSYSFTINRSYPRHFILILPRRILHVYSLCLLASFNWEKIGRATCILPKGCWNWHFKIVADLPLMSSFPLTNVSQFGMHDLDRWLQGVHFLVTEQIYTSRETSC